jgi:hypothetical protein
MTAIIKYWRVVAALALAAALWAGYVHWRDVQRDIGDAAATQRYNEAIAKQKAEAAAQLDDARKRVEKAEGVAAVLRQDQDLKDTKNAKAIADLRGQLRDARGLRDPYAAPVQCGGSGASAGSESAASAAAGGNDTTQSAGLLSAQFAGMLQHWADEADAINIAYESSRADAQRLRQLLMACSATR